MLLSRCPGWKRWDASDNNTSSCVWWGPSLCLLCGWMRAVETAMWDCSYCGHFSQAWEAAWTPRFCVAGCDHGALQRDARGLHQGDQRPQRPPPSYPHAGAELRWHRAPDGVLQPTLLCGETLLPSEPATSSVLPLVGAVISASINQSVVYFRSVHIEVILHTRTHARTHTLTQISAFKWSQTPSAPLPQSPPHPPPPISFFSFTYCGDEGFRLWLGGFPCWTSFDLLMYIGRTKTGLPIAYDVGVGFVSVFLSFFLLFWWQYTSLGRLTLFTCFTGEQDPNTQTVNKHINFNGRYIMPVHFFYHPLKLMFFLTVCFDFIFKTPTVDHGFCSSFFGPYFGLYKRAVWVMHFVLESFAYFELKLKVVCLLFSLFFFGGGGGGSAWDIVISKKCFKSFY